MDTLVPAFVTFGGVHFPLEASSISVGLTGDIEELGALRYTVDQLVNGDAGTMSLDELSRHGFIMPELWALPIIPARPISELADGPINWFRLSGYWPDTSDAFQVAAGFLPRYLVIPRTAFLELTVCLRSFRAAILSGRREGRVNDTPVPPLPPLTPELEEHERLRAQSFKDAQAYREKLYERRQ